MSNYNPIHVEPIMNTTNAKEFCTDPAVSAIDDLAAADVAIFEIRKRLEDLAGDMAELLADGIGNANLGKVEQALRCIETAIAKARQELPPSRAEQYAKLAGEYHAIHGGDC